MFRCSLVVVVFLVTGVKLIPIVKRSTNQSMENIKRRIFCRGTRERKKKKSMTTWNNYGVGELAYLEDDTKTRSTTHADGRRH